MIIPTKFNQCIITILFNLFEKIFKQVMASFPTVTEANY